MNGSWTTSSYSIVCEPIEKKISWYINAIIYKYILYMWLIIFEKVMHNNRFKKEERSWKGKKKGKEEETYSSF